MVASGNSDGRFRKAPRKAGEAPALQDVLSSCVVLRRYEAPASVHVNRVLFVCQLHFNKKVKK